MGDSPPTADESTKEMLDALAKYAPDAIRAIASTTPDTARQQYAIDKELYPQYYELDRQNQLQGSRNELEIARGTGSELAGEADRLQRQIDPEFYKSRGVVSNAIDKLIGGYDPNQLSPSEMSQIERGLAREGPVAPSALNTVRNAQVYGDRGNQRWQNFSNAIAQAGSVLPALKTGFSGFEVATRRALSPLPTNSTTAIGTNFGFANNLTTQIGENQRASLAKKKDTMDMVSGIAGAAGSVAGGVGAMMM